MNKIFLNYKHNLFNGTKTFLMTKNNFLYGLNIKHFTEFNDNKVQFTKIENSSQPAQQQTKKIVKPKKVFNNDSPKNYENDSNKNLSILESHKEITGNLTENLKKMV